MNNNKEKNKKSIFPLLGAVGAFLFLRNRKKKSKVETLTYEKKLSETTQNNTYNLLLDEEILTDEEIKNTDFLTINNKTDYNPKLVQMWIVPNSVRLFRGAYFLTNHKPNQFYRLVESGKKLKELGVFTNPYYTKKGEPYFIIEFVVNIHIPTTAYGQIEISKFLVSNLKLLFNGKISYENYNDYEQQIFNYDFLIKNNDEKSFIYDEYGYTKKNVIVETSKFQDYIKEKKISLKDGDNYFLMQFVVNPNIFYIQNGVEKEFRIYTMNDENGKFLWDNNFVKNFVLFGFSFDIRFLSNTLNSETQAGNVYKLNCVTPSEYYELFESTELKPQIKDNISYSWFDDSKYSRVKNRNAINTNYNNLVNFATITPIQDNSNI